MGRLTATFHVICALLAFYMTVIMVDRYIGNADATSITYKKYNNAQTDKYPVFSICFTGVKFNWYHEFDIFKDYGLTSTSYGQMLMGKSSMKYEYNYTSRLYQKSHVTMKTDWDDNIKQYHLKISDIFLNAEYIAENKNHNFMYEGSDTTGNVTKTVPFDIELITPESICFTRKSNDALYSTRMHDLLTLKKSSLNANLPPGIDNGTKIEIFVHYPGQLIKSFDNPRFASLLSDYKQDQPLEITLSQSTVLKKRPDSNSPCNDAIDDYDAHLVSELSKFLGCIPPYWKGRIIAGLQLEECKSQHKLKEAYHYIQNYNYHFDSLDTPCLDMFLSVTYNWQPIKKDGDSEIKFVYDEKFYEEIEYTRNLNLEGFISSVGGFVGIFLGYSIMQFPAFLAELSVVLRNVKMALLTWQPS